MSSWLLPSLSDIFQRAEALISGSFSRHPDPRHLQLCEQGSCDLGPHNPDPGQGSAAPSTAQRQLQAEFEWQAALAAVQALVQQHLKIEGTESTQGVVLCGPLPVLSDPSDHLATWVFVADVLNAPLGLSLQLGAQLPQGDRATAPALQASPVTSVPVLDRDPLAEEQFCLVLTPEFSVVLVLGQNGLPGFQFSFDPRVIQMCWQALLLRVRLTNAHYSTQLNRLFELFAPQAPDYRLVSEFTKHFTRCLSQRQLDLTTELATLEAQTSPEQAAARLGAAEALAIGALAEEPQDVALLKAIAHEVRTPLATIRTLTRLLLRRKDLAPDVLKRLGIIDHECTEQIDRFGLIFKAAELGPQPQHHPLAAVLLDQLLREGLPRWQHQAQRRNLRLEMQIPEQLPRVVSDPQMLDQALTGLIDRFTRQLPAQSHLNLQVSLAGHQLKLQFKARDRDGKPITATIDDGGGCPGKSRSKSLGQLLSFQPATGSLSLNLAMTKNIFQALGGKLLIKERPQQGEVVTVFLPLQSDLAR